MLNHRRSMLLVHALVGLVAIIGVLTPVVRASSHECGGVKRIYYNNDLDKECVGVTDGTYHFNDPRRARNATDRALMGDINALQSRIRQENALVARQGRYVKLVLIMPLTVGRFQASTLIPGRWPLTCDPRSKTFCDLLSPIKETGRRKRSQ